MASVDVIVPCYNYARFLREAVGSALSQEGVDVRVLIIDDCSTDNSQEVGRELAAEDSRVEYRRHIVNRGHIATYNEGLAWLSRDYGLLLSADDLITPGSLQRATKLMDSNPEIGFTYGHAIKTREPGSVQHAEHREYVAKVISGATYLRSICETGENVVDTPTAMVRTSVQHKVGEYRKELPHAADMELWLRFALHGSVGFIEETQACYRIHGTNMSVAYNNFNDFIERRCVFESLFKYYPGPSHEMEELRQIANQGLATHAFWTGYRAFDRGEVEECEKYLAFALSLHRPLRYRLSWWRLRLKMLLGPRAWSFLRPLAGLLRGRLGSAKYANRTKEPTGPCW